MNPTEALEKCIEAGIFIEPLKRAGPGQVVLMMSQNSPEIAEALKELTSEDLGKLRPDYVMRYQ